MESENGLNLVVLVIDTLRYDHVAANPGADPEISTPNLDQFAERSLQFTNAYVSGFPTIACRNDLMTGKYGSPFHRWAPLEFDRMTLPELLIENGYVTQLIHDTPHLVNGGHRFDAPFQAWTPVRGAEVDRPWITDSWDWPDNWSLDERFDEYGIDEHDIYEDSNTLPRYVHANRNRGDHEDWNVARLFQTATDFLEDNTSRENFFLWIDCFDPHEPWDSPPEFLRQYDRGDGTIDPRSFRSEVVNDPDMGADVASHLDAQYKAKVTFMDHWFGTFLDALQSTGLEDKTAVLVIGDHGTNLGEPPGRQFGKEAPPAQNEAHVPLFLMVPDGSRGRCDAIVQPQDVFATIVSLAGAEAPHDSDSYDLRATARDGHEPRDIALSGQEVSSWNGTGSDEVLFHAFDGEWSLGVTPDRNEALLRRIGEYEDVSGAHPQTVDRLYDAAVDEIERRGLDPVLAQWLGQGEGGPFPAGVRTPIVPSLPEGWETYWQKPFYR